MRPHPISDPRAASVAKASYNSGRFVKIGRQNTALEIRVKGLERASRALNVRDPRKSRLSSQRLSVLRRTNCCQSNQTPKNQTV
jgi:hypothetical protein